jgi:hypothetical protein
MGYSPIMNKQPWPCGIRVGAGLKALVLLKETQGQADKPERVDCEVL